MIARQDLGAVEPDDLELMRQLGGLYQRAAHRLSDQDLRTFLLHESSWLLFASLTEAPNRVAQATAFLAEMLRLKKPKTRSPRPRKKLRLL